MDVFISTIGFIAAVVIGIVTMTLFFLAVGAVQRKLGDPDIVKVGKLLKGAEWINVHLAGGRVLEKVKFVGFAGNNGIKGGHIPYQLMGMVILETSAGTRLIIRADKISMIEEAKPDANVVKDVSAE
jgi:hypothetical protein